jgi:hypothetical protein
VALLERIVRDLARRSMVALAVHSPELVEMGDSRVVLPRHGDDEPLPMAKSGSG